MKATREELIECIPSNFPDVNDPKYWSTNTGVFRDMKYWEAVGAWWYVVLNTEVEE